MNKILILGSNGMLGTMVAEYFLNLKEYEIFLTFGRQMKIHRLGPKRLGTLSDLEDTPYIAQNLGAKRAFGLTAQ